MIYIIDNGRGYEDAQLHFVRAPESFAVWWNDVFLPWQKKHKDADANFRLEGTCQEIVWQAGREQTEDVAEFFKEDLYLVTYERPFNRRAKYLFPPEYKP